MFFEKLNNVIICFHKSKIWFYFIYCRQKAIIILEKKSKI